MRTQVKLTKLGYKLERKYTKKNKTQVEIFNKEVFTDCYISIIVKNGRIYKKSVFKIKGVCNQKEMDLLQHTYNRLKEDMEKYKRDN